MNHVSYDDLVDYHRTSEYYLDYLIPFETLLVTYEKQVQAPFYSRAYESHLRYNDKNRRLIFLKYSLVFPYSALPAETTEVKNFAASLVENPMTWHELDIHGAIHIVLDGESKKPLGVILAQHNNHQVLLKDMDFDWPKDDRVAISIAKYSNEPYIGNFSSKEIHYRVVGNPNELDYLLGLTDRQPLTGGIDVVEPIATSVEVDGPIVQLSLDDPLYRAAMSLGNRPKILGLFRTFYLEGPVGIDYYTMPELLDMAELMAFWHIDIDEAYQKELENADLSFVDMDIEALLSFQRKRLFEDLNKID